MAQNKLQYRRKTVSHCGTQQRKGGALVENSNGGVQSVARIFALIEVLCAHPKGASLQTISAESGLPKSTAHRLLSSLVSLGYAVQDSFSTHYRLTMKMFELSSGIVNDMDIMSVAKPHLDKLSRHTGEAVHLVIQDGVDIVYIYKAEAGAGLGGMRMSSHVGLRIPMYCTGVGKAILATQSYGEAERVWRKSSIRALTAHTITDFDAFIEQLKRVRMAGYAIDDEENELGIRCVALAVPGMNGRAEAAFSISGLAAQMTDDRIEHLARMGLAARQDILRDLGWK
nr:IclR family transcriptional regulator [Ruthenibacterium lactatiformans]